jgi:hypothetical protein
MENFNALEKEWINTFESADTNKILQTVYEIRNSGSVRILPSLMGLIKKDTDPQISFEIFKLLSELKTAEAAQVIAESLRSMDFGEYLGTIVASCWQSGLDFSKHFRVFIGLFVQSDYKTALEAFTVIEESLENAAESDIHDCLQYLKEAECMISEDKMPLFLELKRAIEDY